MMMKEIAIIIIRSAISIYDNNNSYRLKTHYRVLFEDLRNIYHEVAKI